MKDCHLSPLIPRNKVGDIGVGDPLAFAQHFSRLDAETSLDRGNFLLHCRLYLSQG
jgi:hypothetical protein